MVTWWESVLETASSGVRFSVTELIGLDATELEWLKAMGKFATHVVQSTLPAYISLFEVVAASQFSVLRPRRGENIKKPYPVNCL